jgi:hypothetical protein
MYLPGDLFEYPMLSRAAQADIQLLERAAMIPGQLPVSPQRPGSRRMASALEDLLGRAALGSLPNQAGWVRLLDRLGRTQSGRVAAVQ